MASLHQMMMKKKKNKKLKALWFLLTTTTTSTKTTNSSHRVHLKEVFFFFSYYFLLKAATFPKITHIKKNCTRISYTCTRKNTKKTHLVRSDIMYIFSMIFCQLLISLCYLLYYLKIIWFIFNMLLLKQKWIKFPLQF